MEDLTAALERAKASSSRPAPGVVAASSGSPTLSAMSAVKLRPVPASASPGSPSVSAVPAVKLRPVPAAASQSSPSVSAVPAVKLRPVPEQTPPQPAPALGGSQAPPGGKPKAAAEAELAELESKYEAGELSERQVELLQLARLQRTSAGRAKVTAMIAQLR